MSKGARSEAYGLWQGLKAEHDRYNALVPYVPMNQLRVQDDLRRYLCLRCAGFLEQITFVAMHGYLEQKAGGPALQFAQSWFHRAPNLTLDAFTKLVARFGPQHAQSFDAFMTPLRKEALHDLFEVRNPVAHGERFEGQKLAPARYVSFCEDAYEWLVENFLGESVEVLSADGQTVVGHEKTPT